MDYKAFYNERWHVVWALVIGLPVAVLTIGCLAWPEVFWDGFLWRYIWGPIVADATDRPQGDIVEGYNAVSTVTYALVLAVAVMGIWRAFVYLGIRLDAGFLVAMVPWVLLGSVLRALEDASLFAGDGVLLYLFISPVIYIVLGLTVFFLVVVSHLVERRSEGGGIDRGHNLAGYVLLSLNVVAVSVSLLAPGQLRVHAPLWLLPVASAAGWMLLNLRAPMVGRVEMTAQVAVQGSVLLVLSLYFVGLWASGGEWVEAQRDLRPWELVAIPATAIACTAGAAALFWALSRRWPDLRAMVTPVALLLFLAHFLDGAATWRGVDFHGYSEKHVLPSLLIEATGTAAVMLPLKLAVVALVVYVMDVAYRDELERSPDLAWLVRVAVLVLGLAPGMRDMLRLAMGV